jgi:uncharacterized repeat protein (TIGR01451 family)
LAKSSLITLQLAALALLALFAWPAQGQPVQESFANDPVANGRFSQLTTGTASQFTFNAAAQNLTAVLDVSANPAYYLSAPFTPLTDAADASFSVRFRVEGFVDQEHPTAYAGLMTDRHVNDYGDGLLLVVSLVNGIPTANADIESFDQSYGGTGVVLQKQAEYLAVGQYRANLRELAVEVFTGPGFTNLLGASTVPLPQGRGLTVNRIGLQNAGVREIAGTGGEITLTVDDLWTPANNPRQISISDATVTAGSSGTTNAVFTVQLTTPSTLPLSVAFATADGTALAGSDYLGQAGSLTFAPGLTSQTIAVPVLGAGLSQKTKQFSVVLSNPQDATLLKGIGVGTILNGVPPPLVSIADATAFEGNSGTTNFQFLVTLSGPSGTTVTVNFATADVTAIQGTDYLAATGTLTFAPGQTSNVVQVPVIGNTIPQPDRTFVVNLSQPVNATVVKGQAVGTILDDDSAGRLFINDVTQVIGQNGITPFVFTVALTRPSGQSVSVDYSAASGTAVVGTDLLAASGTLTFPAGAISTNLTVSVLGTTSPALDKTFFVNLSNPRNATIARASGLGTIRNNNPFPQISIGDVSLPEGDVGTTLAKFPVTLSFSISQPVTVSYSTSDGTALANVDYQAESGTVTFAPGTTTQTISVPVIGNTINEPDKTFSVDLSKPVLATLGRGHAVGTIVNDDAPPVLSVGNISLLEGNSGTTNAVFTVQLFSPSGYPVTVSYQTADGTAVAGNDYIARFGTLTFAPGTTSQTIAVPVIGDTQFEPDESFLLVLSNPVHATLGNDHAVCTIINDDPAPQISINGVSVTELPGGTNAVFLVTLSAPSPEAAVSVNFATADATATAGLDYLARSGTLTIAPGDTQATLSVPILSDQIHEPDEVFLVNLSSPTNAVLGNAQGIGTIHDNNPPPKIFIHDAQVLEGDSGTTELDFTVTLDAPTGLAVSASFATSDGTATAASGDYVPAAGVVQLGPGQTNATIRVLVNGDTIPEPDETLFVTLTQLVNALAGNLRATGTILDDDTIKVSIADTTVTRGPAGTTTNAVFSLTLNKASAQPVSVDFATADGTAVAGIDYNPASGTVTFPPGVISTNLSVTVIGNDVFEPPQTFYVNLTNSVNALLARSQGVCTIRDDDHSLIIAAAGMSIVSEDCAPANNAIDPGETVAVSFALADLGTVPSANVVATLVANGNITPLSAPQNYGVLAAKGAPVGRTFTFRADGTCGQTVSATLQLQNGGTNYGTVPFTFQLGVTAAGQTVCCNSADIVVSASADLNPVTANHPLTYSLSVTNLGPKPATNLKLTNIWRAPITFLSAVSSQGTSTNQGQTVVCDLGTLDVGSSATIQLVVAPQQAAPLIGVFTARASENDPNLNNNTAIVATVVNPPPGISISNVQVQEGNSGTTNAVFTIQLSPPSGRDVAVNCSTADGTAKAGQDYIAAQATVTIPAGASAATFAVAVIGNTNIQPDRIFYVSLSNPVNASLAAEQTTATGTIIDDDFPTLFVDDLVISETTTGAPTNSAFAVRLSAAPQKPGSVQFSTADGSAHAPGDYVAISGQVNFAPGQTTATIPVQAVGTLLSAASETFFLNLNNPVNLDLNRAQAQATIVGNSPAFLPQISIAGTSVLEGDAHTTTNAVFALTLSKPSLLPVQVDYTTADGSAIGGSDFVITSGTVSFVPGQTNAFVTVIVNGDNTPEFDENFFVKLSNPVNATLSVSQAQGVIRNDDYLPQLVASGTQLILENCQPPNHAIDPLETVTVSFGLVNRGLGPTTNLTATLLALNQAVPLSNAQTYGALPTNGAAVALPFTFLVDGACGQTFSAVLELRDGAYLVGRVPFDMTLGVLSNGQFVCCSSADLSVAVSSSPAPVTVSSPLTYLVTVTNRGPSIATGVVLTNKFSAPVQFLFSSLDQQNWSVANNQFLGSLPDLAPGNSLTVTNIVAPGAIGDLFNYVLVAADEYDPASVNNLAVDANKVVPPTGLSINDITVTAGLTNHTEQFTVLLYPPQNQSVRVAYSLSDGTARAGQDYFGSSGTLTFPPGVTSTNVNVLIVGNPIGAPDKVFYANLSNPSNALIARGQGTCTIVNHGLPAISINDVTVNVGTNALVTGVVTVTLSSPGATPITVDYFTTNGTAVAGSRYEAQHGTLTFAPGVVSMPIRIPIAGNTADQGEQQFYVQLLNPQNATLAWDEAIVAITDLAPADLTVANTTVVKPNSGLGQAAFNVTLRKPIQNTVTVDFFTSNGSALAGNDYTATNGTLTFPPGILQATVNVPVIGNNVYEPDITFFLNLTNAFNGIIRNAQGIGTITSPNPIPCLSIGDLSVVKGSSGTNNALMPVRLSGPSSLTASVQVLVPSCGASSLNGAAVQTIEFPPGQVEQFAVVPIPGNTVKQPDQACLVVLTNAVNATVCRGQATLTVIDNNPLPGLEINDVSLPEGNSGTTPAVFTVTLVGATSEPVTVQYSTTDGTAKAGTDYVATSGSLNFAPGTTSTNISVLVIGNLTVEPDKTFFVNLTHPVNATLFKGQGTGTILNDDTPPQQKCPSVVVLAIPGNQNCFQPFTSIALQANPDQGADQIDHVEFYAGSTLLGVDSSSPFQIVWDGAADGEYCLTAKAICRSGLAITSDPTCIAVTESGAAVAIVRNFDDPEINIIRDYLLEMGYCAQVFDRTGLTFDALSSFQLVIWDDLGAEGLTDSTVATLQQLFSANTPLYFIGDRLASTANSLSAASQAVLSGLTHLVSAGQTAAPGLITFSSATQDRQPGAILSGRFADFNSFPYTNAVALATVSSDATSLAAAGGFDEFVEYPDANTLDEGQARAVSQCFRILTGGDADSIAARKALFQNAVCWLLRCSSCGLVKVSVVVADLPPSVNVGDQFTFSLTLINNGECVASATVMTNQLPAGLSLVNASFNQGIGVDYNPATRVLVFRAGSLASGADNSAVLTLTLRAVQAGAAHSTACATANSQRSGVPSCTDFDLTIGGVSTPNAPTLTLLQTGYGLYELRLTGDAGVNYQLQTSRDLVNWLQWTNAPGPLFYLELPEIAQPGTKGQFYRAEWP